MWSSPCCDLAGVSSIISFPRGETEASEMKTLGMVHGLEFLRLKERFRKGQGRPERNPAID
jgi:hypothetical protein